MSKTAAVFTATGIQGSSVVDALLKAGYKVTGFTRDTTGAKAKALTDRGVEVVKADLDDPSTYSGALKDKDAVFVNADFWSFYLNNGYNAEAAKEGEIKHAKNAIQAAVDAGAKHIVYSTLDGGLGCDHWDSKAEVSDWAKKNNYPVTHLYLTAYFNNVYRLGLLKANDDGSFTLGMPCPDDTVVPGLDAEQTGSWVVEAFKNPDKWLGKDMYGVTDAPTVAQMAKTLSEVSGKTVKTNEMSKEYFLSDEFKNTIGKELWDQWKLFYDGNPKRDIPVSKALINGALDFESWAKQDKALHKALGL